MSSHPLTFNEALRGILDFIEVATHTILYVRQVYPADLFVRRRKYDTAVFQSRHPALNEYISGAIKAIGEEMATGNVDKVVIIIKDKETVPLERFIFAVENMISPESFNKDTSVENAMTTLALGVYFRSFLVKLAMIEAQLGQMSLGDDMSFAIVLELKDDKVPTVNSGKEPPPWIPATPEHTTPGTSKKAELHMVRAVNTGVINLSLSVQESEAKLRMMKPPPALKVGATAPPAPRGVHLPQNSGQAPPLELQVNPTLVPKPKPPVETKIKPQQESRPEPQMEVQPREQLEAEPSPKSDVKATKETKGDQLSSNT
ncbi:hypothetical protein AX16_000468 [Volvariella volvacea WC 439]|nr:hypothetical protein AX16_000468 [Volvariella volvacea WC 439]